jgi:hypothetical protein
VVYRFVLWIINHNGIWLGPGQRKGQVTGIVVMMDQRAKVTQVDQRLLIAGV